MGDTSSVDPDDFNCTNLLQTLVRRLQPIPSHHDGSTIVMDRSVLVLLIVGMCVLLILVLFGPWGLFIDVCLRSLSKNGHGSRRRNEINIEACEIVRKLPYRRQLDKRIQADVATERAAETAMNQPAGTALKPAVKAAQTEAIEVAQKEAAEAGEKKQAQPPVHESRKYSVSVNWNVR